ncbi:class I SAM-dependent methyltransferase [Williamsia soli]|uniref:class I SAM-dependent methyltransferase n=1 Tax=Williamsia soli TaxID=364929 RepID=UPI001A9E9417|nr:methyltransferase domain-containing protein [Williamsia soli]
MTCRACGGAVTERVLDLGDQPAADNFPPADAPVVAAETAHPLAMDLCLTCGLAQLADDDTVTDEPRGVEPQALIDQAVDAITQVAGAGWLDGRGSVTEFASPHGGSWLPHLFERGLSPVADGDAAAVVVDTFSVMHEPDQAAAFATRARTVTPDGVLLLQFHSLVTIVEQGQWNALRHGHFAYYSLAALQKLLAAAGMSVVEAWSFDLYGGTHLIAAVHGAGVAPSAKVTEILDHEAQLGITEPEVVAGLQTAADGHVGRLEQWLVDQRNAGRRVCAYGAASRASAVFYRAGVDRSLVTAIADASTAKQGRRMPGTDVPITSPEEMIDMRPDQVLLMLPDLLAEVSAHFPQLDGRWVLDDPDGR